MPLNKNRILIKKLYLLKGYTAKSGPSKHFNKQSLLKAVKLLCIQERTQHAYSTSVYSHTW